MDFLWTAFVLGMDNELKKTERCPIGVRHVRTDVRHSVHFFPKIFKVFQKSCSYQNLRFIFNDINYCRNIRSFK